MTNHAEEDPWLLAIDEAMKANNTTLENIGVHLDAAELDTSPDVTSDTGLEIVIAPAIEVVAETQPPKPVGESKGIRRARTAMAIGQVMNDRLDTVINGEVDITRLWEVSGDIVPPVEDAAMDGFMDFFIDRGIYMPVMPDSFVGSETQVLSVFDAKDGSAVALIFRFYNQLVTTYKDQVRELYEKFGGLPHIELRGSEIYARYLSLFVAAPPFLDTSELRVNPPLPSYPHIYYGVDEPALKTKKEPLHTNLVPVLRKSYKEHFEKASEAAA